MTKKGQINIGYKARRIGYNDTEKLVGQANRYSTIEYDAIVAYAAKAAAVPESSIDMSMEALFDAMNYFVLNGHSVQIPNLGTFSIGVSAKSTGSEAEFTADFSKNLRSIKIRFQPDPELKAMIASTSILTDVEEEGYVSDGVIAVKSMAFGKGAQLIPLTAGRTYMVPPVTRLVLNGTRLSQTYLGATPMRVVMLDGEGAEHASLLAGKLVSLSYNQLSVNLKEFAKTYDYVAIKSFQLKDKDGNVIVERAFGNLQTLPYISAVIVDGAPVAVGGTVKYEAGKEVKIQLIGINFGDASVIKVGNSVVEPKAISEKEIVILFTPTGTGNWPVSVQAQTGDPCVYNMSFGAAGGTSIISVTANGDSLNNGGSTTITAGNNYSIAIAGTGLADLTAGNFVVPNGSQITLGSQSDTLIQATITNAQPGDFKVVVDEQEIFAAALVAVTPSVSITGLKLTAEGATQAVTTTIIADEETGAFELFLVGQNLDELAASDMSGQNLTSITYDDENAQVSGAYTAIGTTHLVITNDDTTVASITIQRSSGGDGDDGFDKD
jgi:nucleoid DNA-binding protein